MGHYYSKDGKPVYTVKTKKGARNPERPTEVKDAIELGLLPSVTEITKGLSAPGLVRYQLNQVVSACYHCPPIADEDLPTYSRHIMEKADMERESAATLGTDIHGSLEEYFSEPLLWKPGNLITMPNGAQVEACEFVIPAVRLMESMGIKVLEAETILVNLAIGYAGKTDIVGMFNNRPCIVDFKTTKTKPGKPVEPIETHCMQVAAYWAAKWGNEMRDAVGFNIYISSTEVGRVEAKTWGCEELYQDFGIFKKLIDIWTWRTGYNAAQ